MSAIVLLGDLLAFSPVGLSFVDDFTRGDPIGYLNPTLEIEASPNSGVWQATGVRGLFTPSGTLAYPNLGRRGKAPTPPVTTNYRVTIDTQYYDPLYPEAGGVIFPVTAYDANSDFSKLTPLMVTLPLLPAANYPYAGTAAFLRGQVQQASGTPVVAVVTAVEPFDANVADTKQTRVQTDPGGVFRLPLRWGNAANPTTVTAVDPVSNQSGTISLTYPYTLTNPQTITIPN
jgi:hypothetical protein